MELETLALFDGVGAESLESLLNACTKRTLRAGEILLAPSAPNRSLFVVLSGELDVTIDDSETQPYVRYGRGSCVGEISVIDQARPSATVTAVAAVQVLVIEHDTLWAMVESSHAVARNLLAILARRVRFDNDYIVDSAEILEQHRRNAITDALTGLNNRRWMEELFPRKIQRCRIDNEPACLAIFDLDRFKEFNDTKGHVRGDEILNVAAAALRERLRPNDMIVRYGGDEFAALLPATSLTLAQSVLQRVCREVGHALEQAQAAAVTISAGVAESLRDDTLNSLIARADGALYRAKTAGRNCVHR